MQASKIIPGKVYAIKRPELTRFEATAVVTRRETAHGNPHDYKSKVEGYVIIDGTSPREKIAIDPDKVLGPFEDYVELVERKRLEEEENKRKEAEHQREQQAIRRELYNFIGVAIPNDAEEYKQPFRLRGYGRSNVEIGEEGVKRLIERIRSLGEAALKSKASA